MKAASRRVAGYQLGSGPVTVTTGVVGSSGSGGTANGQLCVTGGTISNNMNIAGVGVTEGARQPAVPSRIQGGYHYRQRDFDRQCDDHRPRWRRRDRRTD